MNPFKKDKFIFNGQKIADDTASKIVFYVRAELEPEKEVQLFKKY